MDKNIQPPCSKCGKPIDQNKDLFRVEHQFGKRFFAHIRCEDPRGDGSAPEGGERFAYG